MRSDGPRGLRLAMAIKNAVSRRLAWAWVVGVLAAALCYWLVDRRVVFVAHAWNLRRYSGVLHPMQQIPEVLAILLPFALVYIGYKVWKAPLTGHDGLLAMAAASLIAAIILQYALKYPFGRYWPETWCSDNPSLLGDGSYGFNPFHYGIAYQSFPSGHTAAMFAVATVLWATRPRWRWAAALCAASVVVGLIGLYYHFVSDVIIGALLGVTTGVLVLRAASACGSETEGARRVAQMVSGDANVGSG